MPTRWIVLSSKEPNFTEPNVHIVQSEKRPAYPHVDMVAVELDLSKKSHRQLVDAIKAVQTDILDV